MIQIGLLALEDEFEKRGGRGGDKHLRAFSSENSFHCLSPTEPSALTGILC